MEKKKQSYKLADIQAQMVNIDNLRLRVSAKKGLYALALSDEDAVCIIQKLTIRDFDKSMTTYNNHQIWQDVYKLSYEGLELYIKFQRDSEGFFTISFKEL